MVNIAQDSAHHMIGRVTVVYIIDILEGYVLLFFWAWDWEGVLQKIIAHIRMI
jgi:hypothetical protein